MLRFTNLQITLLIAVVTGCYVPLSNANDAPKYFPTTLGARWEYKSDGVESVEVISDVQDRDGAKEVEIARVRGNKVIPLYRFLVSDEGIKAIAAVGVDKLTEPMLILKLPHMEGNRWDTVLASPQGTWKGVSSATGPENVEVPAGTFKALRVQYEGSSPGRDKVSRTQWYAPEAGLVKEINDKRTKVLQRFVPGKKD